MASELLVKRLLTRASVSVLAGLLMSSAVLAEDISGPAEGAGISADGDAGSPEVSIDPVDPGAGGGDGEIGSEEPSRENNPDGEEGANYRGGEDEGADDGSVDFGAPEDGETDGSVADDGTDPACAACSGIPEITLDPVEGPDVMHTMTDQVEPRGDAGGGKDFGRAPEHDGGLGDYYRRVVK